MNPIAIVVDVVRDYLHVFERELDGAIGGHDPDEFTAAGPLRPILLIPGVYEGWAFLRPIAVRLAGRGHPVHTVPVLGRNSMPIPDSAAIVARLMVERDLHDVVIVAHSKGGLIARILLNRPDTADRITHVLAVNTPFVGSRLARLMIRRSLREFAPGDALLRRFYTTTADAARITSVSSSFDEVVPDGSYLLGAARNVRLPMVGHFRLLADARALTILDGIAALPTRTDVSGTSETRRNAERPARRNRTGRVQR